MNSFARSSEDRVTHSGTKRRNTGFAHPARIAIAGYNVHLDVWRITHTQDLIAIKVALLDCSILIVISPLSTGVRAKLIAPSVDSPHAIGVYRRSAIHGTHHTANMQGAILFDRDLSNMS